MLDEHLRPNGSTHDLSNEKLRSPSVPPIVIQRRCVLTDRMRMAFKRARAVVEMLLGDRRYHVD
jgi:hypothetical protein